MCQYVRHIELVISTNDRVLVEMLTEVHLLARKSDTTFPPVRRMSKDLWMYCKKTTTVSIGNRRNIDVAF